MILFGKTKLINRLFDRIEDLEGQVKDLHSQNLKLIEMIGHLHDDIAYLKARGLAQTVEDEEKKRRIMEFM
jgi:chaperonin cofactor prefoldin